MIILVADDDRLIRFMMKSMLNDILEVDYTILEAANGREMVRLCRENLPDVVFADIKMPYMNGIEAIEECRRYSDETEYVVISGYSEFEYAQKALKLRVVDYLLKPVEEGQLRSLMDKLSDRIAGHKKESNSRFQLKLFNAFNYFSTMGIEAEYEEEPCAEGAAYIAVGLKSACSKQYQEQHTEFQKEAIRQMDYLGSELMKKDGFYSRIYSVEGTPYFVFYMKKEKGQKILDFVKKLAWKHQYYQLSYIFLYFEKDSLREIYEECERNDSRKGMEMNYPVGTVIQTSEEKVSGQKEEVLEKISWILDAWEQADPVKYKQDLNDLYREYKDREAEIDLKQVSRHCSLMMQQEVDAGSLKELCRFFVDRSDSMYSKRENQEGDVISQVKAYVEKYYMNDIGIGQIAEMYDITPNYLSTIFHQKAGRKFVDYLTEVRIAHAKRLLVQNKTASVKDVAVMVGYNSSRYFATLFQKITGMKPSEYRKDYKD